MKPSHHRFINSSILLPNIYYLSINPFTYPAITPLINKFHHQLTIHLLTHPTIQQQIASPTYSSIHQSLQYLSLHHSLYTLYKLFLWNVTFTYCVFVKLLDYLFICCCVVYLCFKYVRASVFFYLTPCYYTINSAFTAGHFSHKLDSLVLHSSLIKYIIVLSSLSFLPSFFCSSLLWNFSSEMMEHSSPFSTYSNLHNLQTNLSSSVSPVSLTVSLSG